MMLGIKNFPSLLLLALLTLSLSPTITGATNDSDVCDDLNSRLEFIQDKIDRIDDIEEKVKAIDWKVDALMNFLVPKPKISLVPSEVEFGSEIVVTFENPNPVSTNWIGIYNADTDYWNDDLFWSSMCGSQKDWDEPECPPQESGSVTFAGSDPDLEADEQWPPSPGLKKACLLYDDGVPFLVCEEFTINPLPVGTASSSTISATESVYDVDETISVDFTVPIAIQNSWIGVYRSEDADNSMGHIPESLAWMYTACNNVDGDQSENNDCTALATSGTVDIDGRFNSDRWTAEWPLPPDTYRACLSFYNNEPYEEFICSEEFVLQDAIRCTDRTDNFQWKDGSKPRNWCAWVRSKFPDPADHPAKCIRMRLTDHCPVLCQKPECQ